MTLKNPGKADLDKSGTLSSYEQKRGAAIEKAMAKQDSGSSEKDTKSKFMGGGIAYKGGGRAMLRKGGKV